MGVVLKSLHSADLVEGLPADHAGSQIVCSVLGPAQIAQNIARRHCGGRLSGSTSA
jgi:hypothetical protein